MNQAAKKKSQKKKSLAGSRRFKYGSAAIAFTVCVIAVLVAANAIFSALCYGLLWYGDMTTEQVYGITDASRTLLGDLTDEDVHIKIVFCEAQDKLEEEYLQKLVHQCALSYAKEFSFVEVEYIDIIADPAAANKYKTTAASTIKTTNVIIENGKDFRVFALDGFYYIAESDSSVYAFNGEMKITSAILSLAYDNPIAYFTTGHGEVTENTAIRELFENAGYDVRSIDLAKESIDPDAQVVVINGPKYDFMGAYGEVNEIGKIDQFLDNHGNLMVFMDPDAMSKQDFPELKEYLSEWGVGFGASVLKDSVNAVSADGYSLSAEYVTEGMGASLTKSMRENLESVPKTILRNPMPLEILWETKSIDQSSRTVAPVLISSNTTECYGFDGSTQSAGNTYNLLTISRDLIYLDNEDYSSYVLVGGTSAFAADDYIHSNAYGNADVIYGCMKLMGREKVPANIDMRIFEDNSLDITASQATLWTVAFCTVIPLITLICGAVVWLKRKHL